MGSSRRHREGWWARESGEGRGARECERRSLKGAGKARGRKKGERGGGGGEEAESESDSLEKDGREGVGRGRARRAAEGGGWRRTCARISRVRSTSY